MGSALRQDTAAGTADRGEQPLRTSDGRHLTLAAYRDLPRHAELWQLADEGRLREYVRHGWLQPGASPAPIRGAHAELIVVTDPDGRPVASLRKIHAVGRAEVRRLPSMAMLLREQALTEPGGALLHRIVAGRPVAELAGLWKDPAYPSDVKMALYRRAMHDAVDRREVMLLAAVAPEFRALRNLFGERVVRSVGAPVRVRERGVSRSVTLHPAVIDPQTFFADLLDDAERAGTAGDEPASLWRQQIMWDMLRGYPWQHLPAALRARLEQLCPA
ncbi:hypothetical protein CS0771_44660 [Catellatospora sp. IY07-71]|nr:hypothetical protein CS0771_44660 [Catellatospora sp. IY07-71]